MLESRHNVCDMIKLLLIDNNNNNNFKLMDLLTAFYFVVFTLPAVVASI